MTVGSFDTPKHSPMTQARSANPQGVPSAKPAPSSPAVSSAPSAVITPVTAAQDLFFASSLNLPGPRQAITSQLQVQIEDKDGLANFGANDVKATVSGEVSIAPDFLLDKLSGLKSDSDKKFYAPTFDAERRQYVISGKAINKILGILDIGFEIRLGVVDGKLGFRVDSGIKRGAIYGDLSKMLKEQGLTTYEKDGVLFIKPEYKQTINLPALADKPARIEKIGATPDNIRFEIDKRGQIKIQLKHVPLELSSQTGSKNPLKATPDNVMLNLDLGFDKALNPTINVRDGQLSARTSAAELKPYLGDSQSVLSEQLGTALTVGLTGLRGRISLDTEGQKGLVLNTSGQVSVRNLEGTASVTAGVQADLRNGKPVISANDAKVKLLDGTQATAAHLRYDGRAEGLNVSVRDVDGQIKQAGVDVQVTDITGNLTRSKAGTLKADLTGQTAGHVDRDGIKADFSTRGAHSLRMQGNQITADVDQADVSGEYAPPAPAGQTDETPAAKADPKQIKINVKDISAKAKVSTPAAVIDAQASQGGLQAELGQRVSVKTTARLQVSAQGETVQGKAVLPQGATVSMDDKQGLSVSVADAELEGQFANPGKLSVSGKVQGDVDVRLDPQGKLMVDAHDGSFDAKFALKDKVKVAGQGESLAFSIDKQENITLDLHQTKAQTEVTAGKVRLKANTAGERAQVSVIHDDVTVQTTNTQSTLDLNVNNVLKAKGKAGDVTVKVDSEKTGDDVSISARQADVKATVANKKGNLKVDVEAKADVNVHVDPKDNVTVSSKQARSKVGVQLTSPDGKQEKIKVDAQGTNFKVSVKNDDQVGIELQQASFKGRITPNANIAVNVASEKAAPIRVEIDESRDTEVNIKATAPVSGSFELKGQVDASFSNPSGFEVKVQDKASGTNVQTRLKDLTLKGQVQAEGAKLGVGGKGDFALDIIDDEDVKVLYDGQLLGEVDAKDLVSGSYGLQGKVRVDVKGSDVDVETKGSLQGSLKSPAHGGVGAEIQVNGDSRPIRVKVQDNKVSVNVQSGQIQVKDLQQLQLGKPDPRLSEVLSKLESKSVHVNYRDLELKNQGDTGHVTLQSEDIRTAFGTLGTEIELEKSGEHVYVNKGSVSFAPNLKFYELIQEQINSKYNIKLTGTPSFANGEIKLQGEVRSKLGLVQWADFSIKTRVVDNKLVFDLDKANILKVIGKGTIGDVANKVLSKTDIDVFRKGPGQIEIALADIVKDLALTQGINFTDLKLVENRFEVEFKYDSKDLEVSRLAKQKDLAGLKRLMTPAALPGLSAESLSTAYSTYLEAKDTAAATQLLLNTLKATVSSRESGSLERAALWMGRSQIARKQDLDDDITLSVIQQLRIDTAAGQQIIKDLPLEVVRQLADNLDKTISQLKHPILVTRLLRQLSALRPDAELSGWF